MEPTPVFPPRPCRPEPVLIAAAKAVPADRVAAAAKRKAAILAELFGIVETPDALLSKDQP